MVNIKINMLLPVEWLDIIDAEAKKTGGTRSSVIRQIIAIHLINKEG